MSAPRPTPVAQRARKSLVPLAPVLDAAPADQAARAREAAELLAELDVDPPTIQAAALVLLDPPRREAAAHISDHAAAILAGAERLLSLDWDRLEAHQSERLRQLLLVMAQDLRTMFVVLASRIPLLRDRTALPEDQRLRLARATMEVFAPLAGRLGIWHLKWRLEDLALRTLEPDTYETVRRHLAEKRSSRSAYVEEVVRLLHGALQEAGIAARVYGRPKHIYSIVRKMRRKGVGLDEIYDQLAVRVVVKDVPACYAALGVVHGLWEPIAGEFDDYIARPKGNDYRSLHTAVRGPKGRPVEVQIRTEEMHEAAEYGIAAHWRYKEGGRRLPSDLADKIDWLRRLLEWRDDAATGDLGEALRTDFLQDQVYVFTPAGEVVDLPEGSTPVDFAYRIHTQVGHRCRGAKVHGRIVPLSYELQTGDRVEILTARSGGPSRDWLSPHLGYVRTASARQKIRQYFRALDRSQAVEAGRALVEKEVERLSVSGADLPRVARDLGYETPDGLLAAVGFGDVSPGQVGARLLERAAPPAPAPEPEPAPHAPRRSRRTAGVRVGDVEGVLGQPARCCGPVPGDDVVGYVTRGRGLTIHRRDCASLRSREPERIVEVDWHPRERDRHTARLRLECRDRPGLLRDVLDWVVREGARLPRAEAQARPDGTAVIDLSVDVRSAADVTRLLDRLERMPDVVHAARLRPAT